MGLELTWVAQPDIQREVRALSILSGAVHQVNQYPVGTVAGKSGDKVRVVAVSLVQCARRCRRSDMIAGLAVRTLYIQLQRLAGSGIDQVFNGLMTIDSGGDMCGLTA